jgi:hypothetical protein
MKLSVGKTHCTSKRSTLPSGAEAVAEPKNLSIWNFIVKTLPVFARIEQMMG